MTDVNAVQSQSDFEKSRTALKWRVINAAICLMGTASSWTAWAALEMFGESSKPCFFAALGLTMVSIFVLFSVYAAFERYTDSVVDDVLKGKARGA